MVLSPQGLSWEYQMGEKGQEGGPSRHSETHLREGTQARSLSWPCARSLPFTRAQCALSRCPLDSSHVTFDQNPLPPHRTASPPSPHCPSVFPSPAKVLLERELAKLSAELDKDLRAIETRQLSPKVRTSQSPPGGRGLGWEGQAGGRCSFGLGRTQRDLGQTRSVCAL